jgi:hypothetical protein
MGLFSRFKKNNSQAELPAVNLPNELKLDETNPDNSNLNNHAVGIESIYAFLQADYESKGYEDALTNPDESYKADNIKLFEYDLHILIQKVNTYYEDLHKELDFHIGSRSRAGLIDLVEELKIRKEMIDEHVKKVAQIQSEINSGTGMSQRIILSYQRGFMKGMSAITQSKILNKNL